MTAENSTVLDLCDIDNDVVGCQQLCVLIPGDQRQCICAVGFRLGADQRSCVSGNYRRHLQFIGVAMVLAAETQPVRK